jgi:hypothetical protein
MIPLLLFASITTAPLAQPGLRPLAAFVGHCWRGDAPGGAGTDTHCFEAVYGGQHVRDRHTVAVKGKTVYAGETLYSVEDGKIAFTYWNSLGGVGHGTAEATASAISFAGEMREDPASTETPMHATWRLSPSGYAVVWPDGTPHSMQRVKGGERTGL